MDSDSSLDSAGPEEAKSPGSPASPIQEDANSMSPKSPQNSPPPGERDAKTPESPEELNQDSDSGPESPPGSPPGSPPPVSPPSSPPRTSPQQQDSSRSSSPSSRASSPGGKSDGSHRDDGSEDEGSYHSNDAARRSEGEDSGDEKQEKAAYKPHDKEDLSDVSDMESQDGLGFEEEKPAPVTKPVQPTQDALETELDFEAEEKEGGEIDEKEDGECGGGADAGERSDGEVKDGDDLEEGECTDGDDARPEETEPRPICRFYNRGQCTWGSNCRFVHPGVTDKGNYTMFDMVRPLVPANGPPGYHDYRYDKTAAVQGFGFPPKEDVTAPPLETAWERGLRHAKEMMRKATKRKESDMDFEEKKMNLSLGQEDLDKENDFYTRPASPVVARMEETDYRYAGRYEEEEEYYRPPPDQWRRVHYPPSGDARALRVETSYERMPTREKYHRTLPPDFHHPHEKRHSRPAEPPYEGKWKDRTDDRQERYMEPSGGGGGGGGGSSHSRSRGDEWSDPWMRSKSPPRKGAPRRQSYSSGTSYSSSSRSSSRSSYSSYSSRSRSRSFSPGGPRSPGGPPPRQRRRSTNTQEQPRHRPQERKVPRGRASPPNMPERKAPPQSGPTRRKEPSSPPPVPVKRPTTPPIPPPDVKPKPWSPAPEKKSSKMKRNRSPSGSESDSGSSSDSSSTHSSSSSASSRNASPTPQQMPKPAKRIVIDGREALANMVKIKALDALKVSGQKQQIKLTLKDSNAPPGAIKKSLLDLGVASLNSRKDQQMLPTLSRKRPAEPATKRSSSPEGPGGSKGGASKKTPSRREELLKQLKAVEDAIRRKRFKS